ncbi:actin cortical patch SUR7/pH-response regulator pali [Collybia nuda]|uniref:Actin cortical patch SUR7/pH-response regulator pali n=1 Tax=Collybia nuda TaxID=64659 RepID=A0A9P5Y1W8_9AGAR|nr:actin cortical patch SUR7/pH-response regulator pali [Collybia nuda]
MKSKHRPLARHRVVSGISFILLVAAFVLLLLVAVSLPILKPVYLLSVKSTSTGQPVTSIATELRFGVWGVCASSALDQPTLITNNGVCFGPQLGYDIPSNITNLTGVSPTLVQAVQHSLLVILILHPVAAGLSFVGFIFSLFLGPHSVAVLTLIIAILTGIVGSVVFAIDLALVIVVRKEISDLPDYHFDVEWGNGTWMVLTAVAATWFAVLFLSARACYCCGVRKHHKRHHHSY